MLGMYGPCLRRHPSVSDARCVDVAGHSGPHMAHGTGDEALVWADTDSAHEGLSALAAREAVAHQVSPWEGRMSTEEQARLAHALDTLRHAAEHGYPWSIYPAEAAALVAEVERLRREIDNRREMWSQVLVVLAQVLEQQEHRRA